MKGLEWLSKLWNSVDIRTERLGPEHNDAPLVDRSTQVNPDNLSRSRRAKYYRQHPDQDHSRQRPESHVDPVEEESKRAYTKASRSLRKILPKLDDKLDHNTLDPQYLRDLEKALGLADNLVGFAREDRKHVSDCRALVDRLYHTVTGGQTGVVCSVGLIDIPILIDPLEAALEPYLDGMKGFDSFYDKTLMPVIGKINFRVLEELAEFWKGRGVPRYSGDSDLFQYANPWSADMESRVATVMRFKPSTQGIVDKGEVTSTIAELVRERRDQSQKQPSSTGFDRTNPGYGNSGSNPSRDTGSAVFEGSPYNRGSPSVGGSRPYTGQLSLFDDRTPTAPTRGSQAKPNLFLGYQADAGIIYFVILYTDNSMRGDLEDAARSAHLHQEDEHQVLRGTEFGVSGPLSGAMYTVRSESNAYLLDLARRTFPGYNLITEQVSSLQVNLETFDGLNPPEKIELGQFFNRAFGQ